MREGSLTRRIRHSLTAKILTLYDMAKIGKPMYRSRYSWLPPLLHLATVPVP